MKKTSDVTMFSSLRKIVSQMRDVGMKRPDEVARPVACRKKAVGFNTGPEWSDSHTLH
jgi:hypothetical protein